MTTTDLPKSWAEDLNTYRDSRGSKSYATTHTLETQRRNDLYASGATSYSRSTYDDPSVSGGRSGLPHALSQTYKKNGWGDPTLLKHELPDGTNPIARKELTNGKGRGTLSGNLQDSLTGVLQQTEAGMPDGWLGHPLIDPTKGKKVPLPPQDPKGRKDLFDVLHVRNPGKPADDSWLGHVQIDPAKGKGRGLVSDQERGPGLEYIMAQTILKEPNKADLLVKGADPLSDAWCGNRLMDPNRGRLPVNTKSTEDVMLGATYKEPVQTGFSDWPKQGKKLLETRQDIAGDVLAGTSREDHKRPVIKILPEPQPAEQFDGRRDLYAHMTYKPLSEVEQTRYGPAWDDKGVIRRKPVDVPGSVHPAKGRDMLAWKPQHRAANYVPYGKLMQEQLGMAHSHEKVEKSKTLPSTLKGTST